MFVKINFPIAVEGIGRVAANQIIALSPREAMPLIVTGNATPDPYLNKLKERARALGQNADWDKQPDAPRRTGVVATAYPPDGESFAKKLSKAIKTVADLRNTSTKQHDQSAEKERNRYRPLRQRPHTKSE